MRKIIIVLGLFMLTVSFSYDRDCAFFLKQYFVSTNKFRPDPSRVMKLSYTTEVVYNPKSNEPKLTVTGDAYMQNGNFILKSKYVSMYKDTSDLFLVVQKGKQVFRTIPNKIFDANKYWMLTSNLQDSFLTKSKDIICITNPALPEQKTVKVVLDRKYAFATHINYVELTVRKKDMQLLKSTIQYENDYQISSVSNTFLEMNYISTFSFPKQIKTLILKADGSLNRDFNGYRLIDTRQYKQ